MSRNALLIALLGVLAGCAVSQQSGLVDKPNRQVSVGWIRNDWKTCDESVSCPRPTPKTVELAAPVPTQEKTKPLVVEQQRATIENKRKPVVVHFGFASSTPTKAGAIELAEMLKAIREDDVLRIVGHTDDVGSESFNDRLALRRAQFVASWLRRHGIKNTMQVEARGKCCYLEPNDTDDGRAANRRVEVVFSTTQKEIIR